MAVYFNIVHNFISADSRKSIFILNKNINYTASLRMLPVVAANLLLHPTTQLVRCKCSYH